MFNYFTIKGSVHNFFAYCLKKIGLFLSWLSMLHLCHSIKLCVENIFILIHKPCSRTLCINLVPVNVHSLFLIPFLVPLYCNQIKACTCQGKSLNMREKAGSLSCANAYLVNVSHYIMLDLKLEQE